MNTDELFKQVREKYAGEMQCGKGCTACCYGLFDISLADALEVARGFQNLPIEVQREVYSKAVALQGRSATLSLPKTIRGSIKLLKPQTVPDVRSSATPANAGSMNTVRWRAVWKGSHGRS